MLVIGGDDFGYFVFERATHPRSVRYLTRKTVAKLPIDVLRNIPLISSTVKNRIQQETVDYAGTIRQVGNYVIHPLPLDLPIQQIDLYSQFQVYDIAREYVYTFVISSMFEVLERIITLTLAQAQALLAFHLDDCSSRFTEGMQLVPSGHLYEAPDLSAGNPEFGAMAEAFQVSASMERRSL